MCINDDVHGGVHVSLSLKIYHVLCFVSWYNHIWLPLNCISEAFQLT